MKNKLRNILLQLSSSIYSNRDSKILFYHDIHDAHIYTDMSTSLSVFKQHIHTIRKNSFTIVSDITDRENQIKIQFDDGFSGIYECIDFLVKENIPVEIFIITSFIGKENYLTEKQIIDLHKTELVKISSHAHSHLELNNFNNEQLHLELLVSKQIIEKITNNTINSICYPIGKFSNQIILSCNKLNFTNQYSSLPGSYFDNPFPNVYRRNLVQFASEKEVSLVLKGAHNIFNKLYFKRHFIR